MRRTVLATLAALFLLAPSAAQAQSGCPAIQTGAVLTAAQWNACFAAKQDFLGFTPINPANLIGASPITVTTIGITTTVGLNFNSSLTLDGSSNLGINLANPNIFSAVQTVDLGSGTNEPGTQAGTGFAVYGADGATARFSATVFGTSAPSFDGHASLGTRLSPSAVTSGTVLVQVQGKGYDTTSFNGSGGVLHVYAEGTFSSSSHPGAACLATVLSGTVSVVDQIVRSQRRRRDSLGQRSRGDQHGSRHAQSQR